MDNKIYTDFYLHKDHKILHCCDPVSAFLQYPNFRLNLLTGERSSHSAYEFLDSLTLFKMKDEFSTPKVIHLFYEFGYICHHLDELIDENKPLAIFIDYEEAHLEEISAISTKPLEFIPLAHISLQDYKNKFEKAYDHLLKGNCYQLNLTMPFYFRFKEKVSPREFMQSLWCDPLKVGAYAHGTYIEAMDKLFFSNSPECLFQVRGGKIRTMPIKGTAKVENELERDEVWQELVNSKKDESELYMIIDLMRNDLTKIELEPAVVKHKKLPLHVPGLVHQFSIIESKLSDNTNLAQVLKALFPGGSITGAPKKKVIELTNKIESYTRGQYCGSTIFLYEHVKTASINIRSAEVNYAEDEIKYGAGGGVTLLSNAEDEYIEALDKLKSFLLLFQRKE